MNHVSRLIVSMWLLLTAAAYACTAVFALFHPPNPGNEKVWSVVTMVVAVAVFALTRVVPRVWAVRTWLVAVVAAAGAILLLSGTLVALVVALFVLAAAWSAGDFILAVPLRLGQPASAFVAIPLGLVALALASLALAASHALTRPFLAALLAAAMMITMPSWPGRSRRLRHSLAALAHLSGWQMASAIWITYIAILALIWAVAPEVQFDALNYHLTVGRDLVAARGLVVLPHYFHSYYAGMMEMVFAVAIALAGQAAARFLVLAVAFLTAGCVFRMVESMAGRMLALPSVAIFLSVPLVFWEATTADVDLSVGLFIAAAVVSLLEWRANNRGGWMVAAGALAGAAVGVKLLGLFIAPAYVLIAAIALARRQVRPVIVAAAIVAGAVSALPWYAVRYEQTGNPIFPLLNRTFPVKMHLPTDAVDHVAGAFRARGDVVMLAELPFRFTYATNQFSESGVQAGGMGPFPAMALIALPFLLIRRAGDSWIPALFAASYVIVWASFFTYARFFLPAVPLLVASIAAAVSALGTDPRTRRPAWAATALICVAEVVAIPAQYWNIADRFPVANAFGREPDAHLLHRALPGFEATQFLNRAVRPGERVLGLGFERQRFYLRPPLGSWYDTIDLRFLSVSDDPEAVHRTLWHDGYRWLAVDMRSLPTTEAYFQPAFLSDHADLRFDEHGTRVYRLRPPTIHGWRGP
ncbi:MAG: glycosyltransferase 87 family protein [Acidobacteriota bacterium]